MSEDINSYPLAWDIDSPDGDALDPRNHSDTSVLAPWRPSNAQEALVLEIAHAYITRDRECPQMLYNAARDAYAEFSWPQLALGLLEAFAHTAVASQGLALTLRRLRADLDAARERALVDRALAP
jgi:hypothetical protein